MTGQLLVTPEKLRSTSQEFMDIEGEVKSLTQQMMELVRSLGTSWTGEAATAYYNKFNSLENDMGQIDRMIMEHVNDLQEMARNYETKENLNEESANALAADVIS